ncbi:MAG: cryptochrome/photolyase family protein [Anaerolineae bacterium]|nr:cryptochrome/photolyase family protein [Anaerolineae bacterium]
MRTSVWILGDQLTLSHPGLKAHGRARTVVVMIESLPRAGIHPWHKQKLVFVWSAMRHFARELEGLGYGVDYYEMQADLVSPIRTHLQKWQPDRLLLMETAEYGRTASLRRVAASLGARVEIVANDMFLSDRDAFAGWAADRKSLTMEPFYRDMRREMGLLMTKDGPVSGTWNLDAQNRQTPAAGVAFPAVPRYAPDAVTASVIDEVTAHFPENIGSAECFAWPVTRSHAEEFLEDFLDKRLDCFGPYEDAMVAGERALCHSLLSPLLNVGLLEPLDICRRAVARYEEGAARLNSVEGFVRQVIGWREFLYQVYHLKMPAYRESNALGADLPLPAFYWDGKTSMRCVGEAVKTVLAHGTNHHIQRLMVTGNFALIAGADPQAVNAWYYLAYVDAYDWVVTPNVIGMALFADGGIVATKPYAASANYIHKMSDYCAGCGYDHRTAAESDSCPFNALYWDFLARNEARLRAMAPRMNLMLAALARRPEVEMQAIRRRAAELRAQLQLGERL